MEYLVFCAVLVAGISALVGLVAHIKKGTARNQEAYTESFLLLKEYQKISHIKGDLDTKVAALDLWRDRVRAHTDQVSIKQAQKKGGKIINLSDYWKR
jgi:hypothetical protein